jgi:two-component system, chemotaxis family, chemotaxis protein CheY
MKLLIVDDEVDLCDLIELQILAKFSVKTYLANDGARALQIFLENGPFDAVITDYRMPQKTGYELFKEVRSTGAETPFLVCSGEVEQIKHLFKDAAGVEFLQKPFAGDELNNQLLLLLADKKMPEQTKSYLPVSLDLLRRMETPGVNLFIRLNDQQYIKVLREQAVFDQAEFERFKKKKITHLAIESLDYKTFFNQFRKNIFSKAEWKNIDTTEAQIIIEEDWKLIAQANQVFGWSDSLVSFAKENITKTIALAKSNPQLKKVFEKLSMRGSTSYLIPHSYANVFMSTRVLQELDWNSDGTIQKMTFASLFHDLELTEVMFRNKLALLKKGPLAESIQEPSNYQIYHHATRAAEFMQKWPSCPPDVDRIIAQHHEQFDGSGFPNKLNFQTIAPLAGLFIMVEDLVYHRINFPEDSLGDYFAKKEALFSRGDMKPIYQAALKVAHEIDASVVGKSGS